MSLSIQLMTTFKPSSGIQSNFVVGVGGFISNFPPRNYWGPLMFLRCTVSAMSTKCAVLPAQRRACNAQCACMQRINQCISILSSCVLNQWRSISIDLTRTNWKWICFGYVWNRDVTILQFGYAAFMVEIFYVRWSILDQSLHWDLFMRDIIVIIQLLQLVSSADWSKVHHVTQGIFCNDRWWRFAGHYSIEPTGHYLRARVLWILYCKLGLRVQNPHPHS